MKKIYILLIATFVFYQGFGQILDKAKDSNEKQDQDFKTLISSDQSHGGYAGLYFNYSQLDNKDAIFMGARGAWVIGHGIALGIGGTGFINEFDSYSDANNNDYGLAGGYGGLTIEPIIFPKFPVHISMPVLLGVGGVALINGSTDQSGNLYPLDTDAFFIAEPGLELEFNLTRYFRIALGVTYRLTTDVGLEPQYNIKSDVLNGISGGISFKIGKF